MEQMQTHGKDSTKTRCARAMQSKAFDRLRRIKLMETTPEDLLSILNGGKVSVAHYLKRLHNLALSLGWFSVPVLAPRLWPKLRFKSKRGITLAEHQRILAAEKNAERNLFYQLLWEIGSSQSDAAALTAENVDRQSRTLSYFRMKPGQFPVHFQRRDRRKRGWDESPVSIQLFYIFSCSLTDSCSKKPAFYH